ncbi:MAG TPA: DUF2997 domain-containing protein [Methanolinea sp.]|nr:DUF2997 domain-containing protein [Methanolinea sp.]
MKKPEILKMEMQELEIIVESDGNTIIHVKGAKGSECLDITGALEERLGTVTDRTFTADYYAQPDHVQNRETLAEKNGPGSRH